MKTAFGILGIAVGLSACGPAPAPRQEVTADSAKVTPDAMLIDTLAGGGFSGRAGSLWTEAEIAAYLTKDECRGRKPAVLNITPAEGGFSFGGRC